MSGYKFLSRLGSQQPDRYYEDQLKLQYSSCLNSHGTRKRGVRHPFYFQLLLPISIFSISDLLLNLRKEDPDNAPLSGSKSPPQILCELSSKTRKYQNWHSLHS